MKKLFQNIIAIFFTTSCTICSVIAQPYIDVINVHYCKSPDIGFFQHNRKATELNYFNASTTLPVLFHNKKDAIIFSPYFEQWEAKIKGVNSFRKNHFGIVLPVSFLKSIDSKWSILATPIIRINDTAFGSKSNWQFGGALVGSHKSLDGKFTYKFGVYINEDLFGLFLMPLLGIDWQINSKTNLFGLLPGKLILEHQLKKSLYYGAAFRAFTNSYTDLNHYWRVDENQVGIFADWYVSKKVVFNIEAGHSVFRKIRTGTRNKIRTDWQANDNVYLKFGLAYRIRFNKEN
jgi:hypothetical protein